MFQRIFHIKNDHTFPKIYKLNELNYNDIKTEKPIAQIPKKPERKTTRFHELTRGLSPKRKSTKILLNEAQLRKNRKSFINMKKIMENNDKNENEIILKQNEEKKLEKTSLNIDITDENQLNIEKNQRLIDENQLNIDKNLEKNRFIKFRKILINSNNIRNDTIHDYGLKYSKALQNKDNINFSFVSKIANLNEKTFQKNEGGIKLEYNTALKMIQTPIINEIKKIEDNKEDFARIHVFFQ